MSLRDVLMSTSIQTLSSKAPSCVCITGCMVQQTGVGISAFRVHQWTIFQYYSSAAVFTVQRYQAMPKNNILDYTVVINSVQLPCLLPCVVHFFSFPVPSFFPRAGNVQALWHFCLTSGELSELLPPSSDSYRSSYSLTKCWSKPRLVCVGFCGHTDS